jgi:hypothetical protein
MNSTRDKGNFGCAYCIAAHTDIRWAMANPAYPFPLPIEAGGYNVPGDTPGLTAHDGKHG